MIIITYILITLNLMMEEEGWQINNALFLLLLRTLYVNHRKKFRRSLRDCMAPVFFENWIVASAAASPSSSSY
jgi:hypothetical protein